MDEVVAPLDSRCELLVRCPFDEYLGVEGSSSNGLSIGELPRSPEIGSNTLSATGSGILAS